MINIIKKNSKVIIDVFLNSIASFIPILLLQFILLPRISSIVDADEYGKIITLIGLINLIAVSLGGVLDNNRLINFKKYEKLNLKGDFNRILVNGLLINTVLITIGSVLYNNSGLIDIIFIIIISCLVVVARYSIVEFRINLSFKKILANSFFLAVGYGVGYAIFHFTKRWEWLYLCGYLSSLLFVLKNTTILKEPFTKTHIYNKTRNSTYILLISGLMAGTTVYIDRLLLFPVLGGAAVAIYYTATLLGKTISLALQPIASVVLSYLAQIEKINIKKTLATSSAVIALCAVGYFAVIIISKPVLNLLYPQFVSEALNYIYVTTLTSTIIVICNVLNPFLLRFYNVKWQLYINAIYIIIYLVLSFMLAKEYYIMGFCIGALAASILKLIFLIIILVANYLNESKAAV